MDDFDWLQDARQAGLSRTQLATDIYEALTSTGTLSSHRALSYRCPRRCLLLDVLRTPHGIIVAQPRYLVSSALNEQTSNEGGRAKHTEDGNRRWKTQAYFAQDAVNFVLRCKHLWHEVIEEETVVGDLDAGRSEVTVHRQR